MQQHWFKNWFDSPYYHILYAHRDYTEAERFIVNLFGFLALGKQANVLDLACGKGRHALQINGLGHKVVGVDLSPQSIAEAQKHASKLLSFETGDMRSLRFENSFDLVVNLFTSFGYFQQEGDNIKVIESIHKALKPEGLLVLDYLNVIPVVRSLPIHQIIKKGEIDFNVVKKVNNGFIEKTITFTDQEVDYSFQEHVKLFENQHFKLIFEKVGFEITNTFGDYDLNDFDANKSERLILVARKRA